MRAEEYLRIATGDIADASRACDAYRELKCHLDETTAEVVAQGVDPETAAMVAMARMGAPEALALPLAEAHHRHLPWRHYLAVLPLACLVVTFLTWTGGDYWRVGGWWLALLLFCLVPSGARMRTFLRLLNVDLRTKWQWLQNQSIRSAAIAGCTAGILAGITSGVLPSVMGPSLLSLFLLPLLGSALALLFLRRLHTGPIMVTACFAAVSFPVSSLPILFLWWYLPFDWPIMWLFFSAIYSLLALAAGWVAQTLQHKGWHFRT